eukprot:TRINITY_DN22445_c0_g1_i2.p1 TRINITY_DN22445_c0_g1~~TRINITY_DN22445_c0_g1_i2.p1  ORF type:complete len:207 (-),score=20.27 TRINITY_DN22445_c0_g1_i2:150-770(-)
MVPVSTRLGVLHRLYAVEHERVAIGILALAVAEGLTLVTVLAVQNWAPGSGGTPQPVRSTMWRLSRVGGMTAVGSDRVELKEQVVSRLLLFPCCGRTAVAISEFAMSGFACVVYLLLRDALSIYLKFDDMQCPPSFEDLGGKIRNNADQVVRPVWYTSDCAGLCEEGCFGFMHNGGECELFLANATSLVATTCECAGITSCVRQLQ